MKEALSVQKVAAKLIEESVGSLPDGYRLATQVIDGDWLSVRVKGPTNRILGDLSLWELEIDLHQEPEDRAKVIREICHQLAKLLAPSAGSREPSHSPPTR